MQSGPITVPRLNGEDAAPSPTRGSLTFSGLALHHYRLILACAVAGLLAGLLYTLLVRPTYMATATLTIDPRGIQLMRKQSVVGGIRFDDSTYPTHVTILKTKSIALSVIKSLDLTKDPEFVGSPRNIFQQALDLVFGSTGKKDEPSQAELTERALAAFEKRRMITRVATSWLIRISFTSTDPEKAAKIATAIAEAYLSEELEAKHEAAYRASAWMKEHVKDLREQAQAAERAVADFKEQNALIFTTQPDLTCAHEANTRETNTRETNTRETNKRQIQTACDPKCTDKDCRTAGGQAGNTTQCARFRRAACANSGRATQVNVATPGDGIRPTTTSKLAANGELKPNVQWNNPRPSPDGSLLEQDTLTEMTTKLVKGWTETAEAQARDKQVHAVLTENVDDPALATAWNSRVIAKLRSEYGALARREALWANKYGANHQAVVDLRMQMEAINRNLNAEMRRIAETYKNDYEIARERDALAESNLAEAVIEAQRAARARAQLRNLESQAATSRSLYNLFIQRIGEAVPQQTFPFNETRLVIPAVPPTGKIQPRSKLILILSGWIGLICGFTVAAGRDMAGTGVRTSAEAEDALGVKCIAIVPRLKLSTAARSIGMEPPASPEPAAHPTMDPHYSLAVTAPYSRFAEAVRSMKLAIDLSGPADHKVIGMTSAFPNEGKSTLSANFAQLIAASGSHVVLIDADLRNPSLSTVFAPEPVATWSDVVANRANLDEALWREPGRDLAFLSAGALPGCPRSSTDMSNFSALGKIIGELRRRYDYVIVDLPPMAPIADVRATADFIDSYLCVVAWNDTSILDLRHHFTAAPEIYARLAGVVLNKADMSVIGRYDHYDSISNDPKAYRSTEAACA
jgi:succinoglycan biosynthesis transport protein ExoP